MRGGSCLSLHGTIGPSLRTWATGPGHSAVPVPRPALPLPWSLGTQLGVRESTEHRT